jgi:hypothetical protein
MRPLRLARIAAEAEGVRLRSMATRIIIKIILFIIALVFIMGALVFAHIAAWYEIQTVLQQSSLITAGILGAADLVIAIVLVLLASRSGASRTEIEAYEIRRKAIAGIGSALSLTQMVVPLLQLVTRSRRRRRE